MSPSINVTELRQEAVFHLRLQQRGDLRGCIGRITPEGPLIRLVSAMALESAFKDPRFPPVTPRELGELEIADHRPSLTLSGVLAGFPVVDLKVTLVDGKYHDVDSNELSFKMAGRIAFKDAMTRCRPTILEPIMNVEVYVPSDFAGDIMGDFNSRRGRVSGMEQRGSSTVVKAQVPMAEMLTYEQHLTSVTGGRGSYQMEYSHYDEVPAHLQQKIIAAARPPDAP